MELLANAGRVVLSVLGIAWPLLAFLAAVGWIERLARRRRPARRGDAETRGHGDPETRGHGEGETRGHEDSAS